MQAPAYIIVERAPRYCPHTDALVGSTACVAGTAHSALGAHARATRLALLEERCGGDAVYEVLRRDGLPVTRAPAAQVYEGDYDFPF